MEYAWQFGDMLIPDSNIGFTSFIGAQWDVALVADPMNTNIVRGTRYDRESGQTESITMYRISDSKNYDGGFVSLTTSIEGLEVIESGSVCWGMEQEPVFDEHGNLAFYREQYFINAFPHKGEELVLNDLDRRLMGIQINEHSTRHTGDDARFSSSIFGQDRSFMPIVSAWNSDINQKTDGEGKIYRAEDTFKTGMDSFRIEMEGVAGTRLEGLFIKGTVNLKAQPVYYR